VLRRRPPAWEPAAHLDPRAARADLSGPLAQGPATRPRLAAGAGDAAAPRPCRRVPAGGTVRLLPLGVRALRIAAAAAAGARARCSLAAPAQRRRLPPLRHRGRLPGRFRRGGLGLCWGCACRGRCRLIWSRSSCRRCCWCRRRRRRRRRCCCGAAAAAAAAAAAGTVSSARGRLRVVRHEGGALSTSLTHWILW
jgi:hypothetical protein